MADAELNYIPEMGSMRKRIILMFIMSAIAVMSSVNGISGSSMKEIVIATDLTWEPMEFLDQNKKMAGFEIDLMKAAAAEEGYSIRFINVPWDDLFTGLAAGKYDAVCSSVSIKEERKTTMDFSRPYINGGRVLVVRKWGWRPRAVKDLKGKVVGVVKNTAGENILKKNGIKSVVYYDFNQPFIDLNSEVTDAVLIDLPVAARICVHDKDFKGKFAISSAVLDEDYFGVAVKKGNTEVLDRINSGLTRVIEKGIYKELCMKWFGMEVALP